MKNRIEFPKYVYKGHIPYFEWEIVNGILFCKVPNNLFLLNVEFSQRYFNEKIAGMYKSGITTEEKVSEYFLNFFQKYT